MTRLNSLRPITIIVVIVLHICIYLAISDIIDAVSLNPMGQIITREQMNTLSRFMTTNVCVYKGRKYDHTSFTQCGSDKSNK